MEPMLVLAMVATAVIAYFCGCFNGAVIVSKYILKNDIRTHGSGNAGLTNFFRVFGGPLTAVVILLDVVKMVVAVLIGMAFFRLVPAGWPAIPMTFAKYYAGAFCIIGHMFPCMFHFKGGKGVLSGGALALMVDWRVALVVWGGFLVLTALTKWVSLGSCWAGWTFPIATFFVFRDPACTVLAAISGGLLLWKHRGNMKRILEGTESKFSFHPKRDQK